MMNYDEIIDFIFSQLPMYQRIGKAAYKKDLSRTLQLDKYFGSPHKYYKTIHIAGTNGKGSVAHSLASVLQQKGLKTGLYTSPHFLDFRERIKINGQKISKDYIVEFFNKNLRIFKQIEPSFFEMTVALAFEYFKDMNVDVAVIEVGMGGRLDSTNIIKPIVSVITNISYDHTEFLGDTLEKIAAEKAGIIKNNVPVVLGDNNPAVKSVVLEKAQQTNSQVFLANHTFSVANFYATSDNKMSYNILKNGNIFLKNLKFDLTGYYQQKNLPVIIQTYELLKNQFDLSETDLRKGLENVKKNTGLQGRWDIKNLKPLIILDSAHNLDGIKNVFEQVRFMNFDKLFVIYGTVKDKNYSKILKLLPQNAYYFFTQASVPRALDKNELFKTAQNLMLKGEIAENVKTAIEKAKKIAKNNDLILITGSSFIVADALKEF